MRTTDVTEAGLAEAAQRGDADAFGRLVLTVAVTARQVAFAVVHNWDDADDAVQDAVLAAWQAVARFDPNRPFRPWFLRIVTNAALDLSRRRRTRQTEELFETVPSPAPGPDRWADRVVLAERIGAAMEELPERQRVAVLLFDMEGHSHAEVASILGVPEGTVRSYVFHGRRALRRSLGALVEERT